MENIRKLFVESNEDIKGWWQYVFTWWLENGEVLEDVEVELKHSHNKVQLKNKYFITEVMIPFILYDLINRDFYNSSSYQIFFGRNGKNFRFDDLSSGITNYLSMLTNNNEIHATTRNLRSVLSLCNREIVKEINENLLLRFSLIQSQLMNTG